MARRLFTVEGGLQIVGENGDVGPSLLRGSGVPGGDTGEQDDAIVGSVYMNEAAGGGFFKKISDNNNNADWEEVGNVSLDALNWRNETVRAATGDVLSAGNVDPSAFTDLDSVMTFADYTVGEYVIGTAGGTPLLFEVTAVGVGTGSDEITLVAASQPIAANDTFVIQSYLPDSPAAQEAQAIVHYDGTSLIKLSDFNWALADGINLTGSYAQANGTVAPGDTVEAAISKLDGNQLDLTSLSGETQGSVDHGTFTGVIIPDSSTTHAALQALETAQESSQTTGKVTGITTITDIDTLLVDDFHEAEWELVAWEEATPANKKYQKLSSLHNGNAAADASASDIDAFSKKRVGSNFNVIYTVDFNGAGAAQTMRLRASSSTAGITVEFRRNGVPIQ